VRIRGMPGFCFVDLSGRHFTIDSRHQRKWARAIAEGEAGVSLERPPPELYDFWHIKQGPVGSNSQRTSIHETKLTNKAKAEVEQDTMKTYMAFMKEQLDIDLRKSTAENMQRMTNKQTSTQQPSSPQQYPYKGALFMPLPMSQMQQMMQPHPMPYPMTQYQTPQYQASAYLPQYPQALQQPQAPQQPQARTVEQEGGGIQPMTRSPTQRQITEEHLRPTAQRPQNCMIEPANEPNL
ncbi:MAG: hypothetical protein Q9179_006655, partial [Wetmoreana sp. 5 TL-2023]